MEAVDDLYRRYGGNVYRYALAVLGNHADAEDITQTTFLNAYRSLEQGVRPRKPVNWLLTIASNAIKQRFRQESSRPSHVELDDRLADASHEEDGPTIGELLTALGQIPPQQRKALVLREFEGRSYREIAEILGITTTALETLLFRARRSLADELTHHLTCTDAQQAISRAADGRLGRKEKRRLREHLVECADCAHFARLQRTHRHALKGLALVPVPLSLSLFDGFEGTAVAATLPAAGIGTATIAASGATSGGGAAAGGLLAGGMATKAAAVVAAASVAGGVGVVGSGNVEKSPAKPMKTPAAKAATSPGKRLGQTAPRGVSVPGNGVAVGKPNAPGQVKEPGTRATGRGKQQAKPDTARGKPQSGKPESGKAQGPKTDQPRGQGRAEPKPRTGGPASPRPNPPASKPEPKTEKPAKSETPQASTGAGGPAKSNGNPGGGKK
jgi:RNA polymerase sigma factor (sigma-70 family)